MLGNVLCRCTVLYSTVQYSTRMYCTVQYSTVYYTTLHNTTLHYSLVQYCNVHLPWRVPWLGLPWLGSPAQWPVPPHWTTCTPPSLHLWNVHSPAFPFTLSPDTPGQACTSPISPLTHPLLLDTIWNEGKGISTYIVWIFRCFTL